MILRKATMAALALAVDHMGDAAMGQNEGHGVAAPVAGIGAQLLGEGRLITMVSNTQARHSGNDASFLSVTTYLFL